MKRIQTIGLWAARRTLFVLWSCGSYQQRGGSRGDMEAGGREAVWGIGSCEFEVWYVRQRCLSLLPFSRFLPLCLPAALAYLLNLGACAGCGYVGRPARPSRRPWALPRCCFIDKYLHKCENFITPLCLYLNYFLRFLLSRSLGAYQVSVLRALNTLHTRTLTHPQVYFIWLFDCSVGISSSRVGDLSSVLSLPLPARPIYLSNLSACGFNYSYKYMYVCVCTAWDVCTYVWMYVYCMRSRSCSIKMILNSIKIM